jgi:hypothetical protein
MGVQVFPIRLIGAVVVGAVLTLVAPPTASARTIDGAISPAPGLTCHIPQLVGLTIREGIRTLLASGCQFLPAKPLPKPRPGTVLIIREQEPDAGTTITGCCYQVKAQFRFVQRVRRSRQVQGSEGPRLGGTRAP